MRNLPLVIDNNFFKISLICSFDEVWWNSLIKDI
jgi:hypothetical protein